MVRTAQDEQRLVDRVRLDLLAEYAEKVSPQVVEQALSQVLNGLRRAPVRDYVPTLVHRFTRERLRRLL